MFHRNKFKKASALLIGFMLVIDLRADQIFKAPPEAVSSIVVNGAPAQVFSTCIPMPSAKTVDVRVQSEVTNDLGYNVGIGHSILVYNYGDRNGASVLLGTYTLNPAVMTNVTPDIHHLVITDSGIENVNPTPGIKTKCYTLSVWAVSSAGSGRIRVEPGYGHLTVAVRPQ